MELGEWVDVRTSIPEANRWFVGLYFCGMTETSVLEDYEIEHIDPDTCWFRYWVYLPKDNPLHK